jgi:hypothetical protein
LDIRAIKVPSSSGTVHEYVRVVESVRENGRVKQKVVLNLGRRDLLLTLLPMLQRFLFGEAAAPCEDNGPSPLDASTWGPALVVRHFFQQLGLWLLLDSCHRWPRSLPDENPHDDWPSRVLALIANWLLRPVSEHALAGWLETDFVCDRAGRRYREACQLHYRPVADRSSPNGASASVRRPSECLRASWSAALISSAGRSASNATSSGQVDTRMDTACSICRISLEKCDLFAPCRG